MSILNFFRASAHLPPRPSSSGPDKVGSERVGLEKSVLEAPDRASLWLQSGKAFGGILASVISSKSPADIEAIGARLDPVGRALGQNDFGQVISELDKFDKFAKSMPKLRQA